MISTTSSRRQWSVSGFDPVRSKGEGLRQCSSRLPPNIASKLYGCLNFFASGCWGKVFRAGLNDIRECQNHAVMLDLRPERTYPIQSLPMHQFVAASDAAQDEAHQESGERWATVIPVGPDTFAMWDEAETPIAQLELLAVLAKASGASWYLACGQHRCLDGPHPWP